MSNGIGGGGGAGGQLIEGLMILQLSLESNTRLISHLISTGKIVSIMISLIFICLEQKDSISPKSGLVKLCAITLQLLTSQDRKELAHLINSKVDLPVGIRAQYSVPDLNSLSSNSLSKLFLILSTPSFLLKEESNVKLLYYVLECFNNIIHYQMPDNPHLIYSIIKVHQRIESLSLNDQEEEVEDEAGEGDKIFDVDDHDQLVTKSINLQDKGKGKMRDNHQHSTSTMIDPQQYNNLGSTSTSISGSSSSDQFQVLGGGRRVSKI
ncbi:hypothetical protein KEM48_013482 [Puccinia striiformis f. sp. tritici PST-130]|nr:hypothetical protein KEM48_013482 [Puccinia striiformis f. sp. tritici PST-130]